MLRALHPPDASNVASREVKYVWPSLHLHRALLILL